MSLCGWLPFTLASLAPRTANPICEMLYVPPHVSYMPPHPTAVPVPASALQPWQDWGREFDMHQEALDYIISLLMPPTSIDVLLVQGWAQCKPEARLAIALARPARQSDKTPDR